MNWIDKQVDISIPDNVPLETALSRSTHLAIGAHADDLEIFAYPGIAECYRREDRWFTGITVTDGAGSPRGETYAGYSEEELVEIRKEEQREAARIGQYGLQIQLGLPSKTVRNRKKAAILRKDLTEIMKLCRPEVVYLHNPLDRHATHVAVFLHSLEALRSIPRSILPKQCYGCEGWRDLDWLPDSHKVYLDVSARPHLAQALIGLYDSQIAAGKRYDRAISGRREANATFSHSHSVDTYSAVNVALDLMPLVLDRKRDPHAFAQSLIREFSSEVSSQFEALL